MNQKTQRCRDANDSNVRHILGSSEALTQFPDAMATIRIVGVGGELVSFAPEAATEWTLIFDVATAIKRVLGIRRGQQRLCLDAKPLSLLSPLPACGGNELVLTLVRSPAVCDGCRRRKRGREKRVCSGCRSVRYCSEACQRIHWPCHRPECRRARKVDA